MPAKPTTSRRRGRQPGGAPVTSREAVTAAALDVLRSGGLAALSLREVASVLGVHQTSLYHYVRSKDELLTAMAEQLLSRVGLPPSSSTSGAEQDIRTFFHEVRAVLSDHVDLLPWLTRIDQTASGPLAASERVHALLMQMGLSPAAAAACFMHLRGLTLGSTFQAAVRGRSRATAEALRARVHQDAEQFPALAEAYSAQGFPNEDELFNQHLDHVFRYVIPGLLEDVREGSGRRRRLAGE